MLRLSISCLLFFKKADAGGDWLGWRTVDQGPLPARNAALASSRLSATPPMGPWDGARLGHVGELVSRSGIEGSGRVDFSPG
jgi:hypothetical protein